MKYRVWFPDDQTEADAIEVEPPPFYDEQEVAEAMAEKNYDASGGEHFERLFVAVRPEDGEVKHFTVNIDYSPTFSAYEVKS